MGGGGIHILTLGMVYQCLVLVLYRHYTLPYAPRPCMGRYASGSPPRSTPSLSVDVSVSCISEWTSGWCWGPRLVYGIYRY